MASGVEDLGARLQRLRKGRGLTQAALAGRVGVSTPALCRWEKGQVRPRDSNMSALASALDVPVFALANGDEERAPAIPLEEVAERPIEGCDAADAVTDIVHSALSRLSPFHQFIAASKAQIARIAGTTADKVTILIEV